MDNQFKKITDLTAGVPVETDVIPYVDVSDTTQSPQGTTKKALKSDLKGVQGDSAYEVAVSNGFTGTEAEWLESLNGSDGIMTSVVAGDNITVDSTDPANPIVSAPDVVTLAYFEANSSGAVGFIQGVMNDVTTATDPIDFNGTPTISSASDFTEASGVITVKRSGTVTIMWNGYVDNSRSFDFNMSLEINGSVPTDFQVKRVSETQGSWNTSWPVVVNYIFQASTNDTIELKTTGTFSGDTLKSTLSATLI